MSSLEDMADFYYATLSTSRPRVLTDNVSVEHTIPRPQVPCVYFVSGERCARAARRGASARD